MKKINTREIECLNLQELDVHGSEARLFYKDDLLYKKFKTKYNLNSMKNDKIDFLSELKNCPDAVLPIAKGIDSTEGFKYLDGYFMKYYKNSITLKELKQNYDEKTAITAFLNTSLALKRIHNLPYKLVIGDASDRNIILLKDENNNYIVPKFVDFDGIQIGFYPPDRISPLLSDYFSYLIKEKYNFTSNIDRLTQLLYYLDIFFALDIIELPMYEYDKESEKFKSLKELRSIVLELKNATEIKDIPYIPYIFEIENTNVTKLVK